MNVPLVCEENVGPNLFEKACGIIQNINIR